MELWVDAVLIVVVALLIDRFIGELPNRYHPLRWIGNMVGWLDRRVEQRNGKMTRLWGFLSYMSVFLVFWLIAMFIVSAVRLTIDVPFDVAGIDMNVGEILWILLTASIFKISFAIYSFRHHCMPIQADLRAGDTVAAAEKVQMIVSRNTKGMDAEHISSSCCETISENLVDSGYSPMFYFSLFGLTGSVMFRCANLMDAMWGYLNERYGKLGFFVAKFDDVLGFITSRLSPLFVALAALLSGMGCRGVVKAALEEHTKTPSPNSGWSMTAVAAALHISMEKMDVYVMGTGPMPTVDDVSRCFRLVELASILFLFIVTLPLFVLIGIHVQIFLEDLLFGFMGA